MSKKVITLLLALIPVILGPAIAIAVTNKSITPSEKTMTIRARQFGFDPAVIKVNKGDKVTLNVITDDVTHGFYIDGYGINLTARAAGEQATITFIADKPGKFNFRCSATCGVFHPFMIGKLVVEPNPMFPGSVGLAIGLGAGTLIYLARKEGETFG